MQAPGHHVQAISFGSAAKTRADFRRSAFRFGDYQLIRPLGRGGMAEVWMARPALDSSDYLALKRMLPELRNLERLRAMFLDEADLALRLRHPNLLRTHDVGEVNEQPYIAMELLDGIDLRELLRARKRALPVPCSTFIAREICNALAYAHALTDERGGSLKLVHRDVSLSNVMVGREGSVKLLDFGVAKRFGVQTVSNSLPGTFIGKPGYIAPERLAGGDYDHRVDIFAVGVVLHEMLTGRRLFKGQDEDATIDLNHACQVQPPSSFNSQASPRLDQITLRALARDPETRYGSAAELAAELSRVLAQYNWHAVDTAGLVGLSLRDRAMPPPGPRAPMPPFRSMASVTLSNRRRSAEHTSRCETRDTIRDNSRPY
jgi:serine/threonine-protein kinase